MTIADCRLPMADWVRGRALVSGAACVLAVLVLVFSGCITKPQNPAATQPATAIDLATTQPSYWLAQPAAAQVQARDFDALWDVCKTTARDYLYALDREDYRSGVITTAPLISKQWLEPWRPDTGTAYDVLANSLGAIRRTLRFEVSRNADDGMYTVTPKVLVERESILERRVTDVSQYRFAFSGPATKIPPREAVTLEPETYPDVPIKYWYPTGRDTVMEKQVAERVRHALERRQSTPVTVVSNQKVTAGGVSAPFVADGIISATGLNQTYYINLGVSDKVVAGMTFEVYEARATLPSVETYSLNNPGSKGWIEVVSVGNGSSECRVKSAAAAAGAAPPKQGDQIFNFVFERGGRQNHFAVMGDFAIDRETLTGLIWRWNGVVDEGVSPQTNYLILGTPPKDAATRQRYDAARSQAEQLKIPSVDEDKFNLLIRHYHPGKR
jgi:hypothetical protein